MKLDGQSVSPGGRFEAITTKNRGALPIAPVIQHADNRELARKLADDAERLARVSDGTRFMLLKAGFGAVLALALATVVVAKKADSSGGQVLEPLKPVEGLDYEDPILDKEVDCLRTESNDRIRGTTSAWKEENCNVDALEGIGTGRDLASVTIARSNLGVNAEEWIMDCVGKTDCSLVVKVGGRAFNPSVDKKFVKPVPRYGIPYTKRIYSK